MNAALACAQLENLNNFIADKRRLAKEYAAYFSNVDWGEFFLEPINCQSNYWLNAVIAQDKSQRNALLKISNEAGVMTRPLWRLMSDLKIFEMCQTDSLENSKWLQRRVVNLPSSALE